MSDRCLHRFPHKAANIALRLCLLLFGVYTHALLRAQINATEAVEMGRAALFYDDYRTAMQYFNAAIEARPYMAEAYYGRGLAQFSYEDYQQAEDDLTKAIVFNPFHAEYYQLRGLCRIYNGRYDGAVEDYTRVLEENPEDKNGHYNRTLCRYELGDYTTASRELDYIIHRWPRFARAYVVKAQTCLELHDTIEGLFWIDSLLVMSRREPAAWAIKARYAYAHADYLQAENYYTQALRYDASNREYYMNRAAARCALGNFSDALNDYDRIAEIHPGYANVYYNRALIRSRLGQLKETLADADLFLALEPENAAAAELRRRAAKGKSVVEGLSLGEFHQLILTDETNQARSFMEEFKGKVENRKNERVFLPAYRTDGSHLVVDGGRHPLYCHDETFMYVINRTNTEKGVKVADAIAILKQYLPKYPDDAVLYYNLGCLEVEGGRLDDARDAFDHAISLDPLLAEAYYNKAVVYLLQNKIELAAPLLSKAGEMGITKAFALLRQSNEK